MPRRRAMTSEHASDVKVSGHRNENHFAFLIGGQVNLGSHLDKKDQLTISVDAPTRLRQDVIDWQHTLYSE